MDGLQMKQRLSRAEYVLLEQHVRMRLQHGAPAAMSAWADAHPELPVNTSRGTCHVPHCPVCGIFSNFHHVWWAFPDTGLLCIAGAVGSELQQIKDALAEATLLAHDFVVRACTLSPWLIGHVL